MRADDGAVASLLVSPAANAVWLVLCVLTAVYGKTLAAFFLGFVFLLATSSYLWAKMALKDVEFEIIAETSGVFPGQAFTVNRTIRNRKLLPLLWVEFREACSLDDCALPDENVIAEREDMQGDRRVKVRERLYRLSFVKWLQAVSFSDEWTAARRGIMSIGETVLRSGDGFGLCVAAKRFQSAQPRRITVYPRLVDVSVGRIINDMWDTRSSSGGFLKDRNLVKTVRDYLPGDPARDINMRLLARGQTMKVNCYEIVAPDSVLFIVDAASFSGGSDGDFEMSLSVVASLIDGLMRRGLAVSLLAPESEWFPEECSPPAGGLAGRDHMFELLAALSRDGSRLSERPVAAPELYGQVYYVAGSLAEAGALRILGAFPDHRTRILLCDDAGAAVCGLRVRSVADFVGAS